MKREVIKNAVFGQLVKKAALVKTKEENGVDTLVKRASLKREQTTEGRELIKNATFGALIKVAMNKAKGE